MAKRAPIPQDVQTRVLVDCRRRCCLCVFLDSHDRERPGQIAHVDHDASNADVKNLAFLCLEHHDRYDSQTSQSKGISPSELCEYRDRLTAKYKDPADGPAASPDYMLRVLVSPTRSANGPCASFRVENCGRRPIRLVSWMRRTERNGRPGFSESADPSLPRILQEREEHTFVVELGDIEPAELRGLGVCDSDRKKWEVAPVQIEAMRAEFAKKDLFKHLMPPDEEFAPADMTAESLAVTFSTPQSRISHHLSLVARVVNTSLSPVPIISAHVDWEYSPPRVTSGDHKPGLKRRQVRSVFPARLLHAIWHREELQSLWLMKSGPECLLARRQVMSGENR